MLLALQGLQESRALAWAWELQAQEALTKIEHLKELLGEGIDWQVGCSDRMVGIGSCVQ